jgi:cellulose synthase/poly-beta-1,6-N-acetylglucosamine synthase-like glycosyltransferase
MSEVKELPSVSVCMATLNADRVLGECLERLASQNYSKDKIELIIEIFNQEEISRERWKG